MKIKKLLGNFMLFLSSFTVNLGQASALGVGVDEMPDSLKEQR